MTASRESRVEALARDLLALTRTAKPSVFSPERWQGEMMDWAMSDERLKVDLLRFVDVYPTLRSRSEIARHLREYFARQGVEAPKVLRWGVNLTGRRSPVAPLATAVIRRQMKGFAQRFIVGRDAADAAGVLRDLRREGVGFTLDVLGEACVSEVEAEQYQRTYLDLIDTLAREARSWPPVAVVDRASWGPLPRIHLSVKLTSLHSQLDPVDFEGSVTAVKDRLRPIMRRAMDEGVALTIDLEQARFRGLTYEVFTSLLDEDEFLAYTDAGVVLQAYLRDADRELDRLLSWAKSGGRRFHLRLVKGAYWDYETVVAAQEGWPVPVFTHKPDTDAMYERLAETILRDPGHVRPAFASHNVRSLAAAVVTARELGLPDDAFEIQTLHGMGEPVKHAVRELGLRLREYAPVGDPVPGMAYLVRRLLENTANDSFLRQTFVEGVAADELVRAPAPSAAFGRGPAPAPPILPTDETAPAPFRNHPLPSFTQPDVREAYDAALTSVRAGLGGHHPLVIGGREIDTAKRLTSVNPAQPDEVIGTTAYGGRAEAEAAVAAARAALAAWRDTPARERAGVLFRAAELVRRDAFDLAALVTLEAGKTRREASAEVGDAVDFLEFYGREMLRLDPARRVGSAPGEHNASSYVPRGIALVICTWTSPLALLAGAAGAALVAGNTVIVKPAGPTPVVAARMIRLLAEAGAPSGTVNFLPCPGEEVGDFLVRHAGVDVVAFTGSSGTGTDVIGRAAQNLAGDGVKTVVAAMGGQNAIVVDADADLDVAVTETVASAFHHAGQTCSAASRVIVVQQAHDDFLRRLGAATRSLRVGLPEAPGTRLGPLISAAARERVEGFIAQGMKEARLAATIEPPPGGWPGGGFYVAPHIFADVAPDATIAQEEILGPVLAVMKAKDIDDALRLANGVRYALTGGLMSRSPASIERARHDFRVGNLYINRGITRALVERQPFGGFKMSGTGAKSGGPEYLLHFLTPRVITENTMRRGFAPPDAIVDR